MARELSESRIGLIKMFEEQDKKSELLERKERAEKQANEYRKELNEILDRAYHSAIGIVVEEYQKLLNNLDLTGEQRTALEQERKEFEADPSKKGIIREKCPITNEKDQERALHLTELLKDVDKLGEVKEPDFDEMIEGFGERHKTQG